VSDQISVSGVLATNNSNMWIFKMKLGFALLMPDLCINIRKLFPTLGRT